MRVEPEAQAFGQLAVDLLTLQHGQVHTSTAEAPTIRYFTRR